MSVQAHLLKNQHRTKDNALLKTSAKAETRQGETVWGAFSLLLCLALGPFAALPVLFSLFSLIPGDETMEPESAGK
ncbi:MAG: hypothetical protein M0017_11110 [Desulfobacteraceae bacterium]|nr:hypothetical protein [Desulfobacteraceae bacterium]